MAHKLSPEKLAQYKEVFEVFDDDKNGKWLCVMFVRGANVKDRVYHSRRAGATADQDLRNKAIKGTCNQDDRKVRR